MLSDTPLILHIGYNYSDQNALSLFLSTATYFSSLQKKKKKLILLYEIKRFTSKTKKQIVLTSKLTVI